MWSTVFITKFYRRSFIEMCLERSYPAPLDVTIDTDTRKREHPGCACDKVSRDSYPSHRNEKIPCEWHFQLDPLANPRHSTRLSALDITFDRWKQGDFLFENCPFFATSFPKLSTLKCEADVKDSMYLFTTPPLPPTLRSLTYKGPWNNLIASVKNLTSFVLINYDIEEGCNVEDLRLFMLNNQSLETLELSICKLRDDAKGPPVYLHHLKSLTLVFLREVSTIIRVPALSCLSDLQISPHNYLSINMDGTGDGVKFSVACWAAEGAEVWEEFTGYARPSIRHVRLLGDWETNGETDPGLISVFSTAHTLDIGEEYFPCWYDGFLEDLKQLGPQLKTMRFEIRDREFLKIGGKLGSSFVLDAIEELVKYRFEHGRPFSSVERWTMEEDGELSLDEYEHFSWEDFCVRRGLDRCLLTTCAEFGERRKNNVIIRSRYGY